MINEKIAKGFESIVNFCEGKDIMQFDFATDVSRYKIVKISNDSSSMCLSTSLFTKLYEDNTNNSFYSQVQNHLNSNLQHYKDYVKKNGEYNKNRFDTKWSLKCGYTYNEMMDLFVEWAKTKTNVKIEIFEGTSKEEIKVIDSKPTEKKPIENNPIEEKPIENNPIEEKPIEEKPIVEPSMPKIEIKPTDVLNLNGVNFINQIVLDNVKTEYEKTINALTNQLKMAKECGNRTPTREIEGLKHSLYDTALKLLSCGKWLYVFGDAGTGKSKMAMQLAESLGCSYYNMTAVGDKVELQGFCDINGKYHETPFYKFVKDSLTRKTFFMLDEADSNDSNAFIGLNTFLARNKEGLCFPNGEIIIPNLDNCFVMCAGNTNGRGETSIYNARNTIDFSTLDRFQKLKMEYDIKLDYARFDSNIVDFVYLARKVIKERDLQLPLTSRTIERIDFALKINMSEIAMNDFSLMLSETEIAQLKDSMMDKIEGIEDSEKQKAMRKLVRLI